MVLNDLRYTSVRIANYTVQRLWEWDNFRWEYKLEVGEFPDNKSKPNIYRLSRERFPAVGCSIVSQTSRWAENRYANIRKDMFLLKKFNARLNSLRRQKNYKSTTNHKYFRIIVDEALKRQCSAIVVNNDSFFIDWTVSDLVQKIKYKVNELGLKFIDNCNPASKMAKPSKVPIYQRLKINTIKNSILRSRRTVYHSDKYKLSISLFCLVD